jgi:hypothetical protein
MMLTNARSTMTVTMVPARTSRRCRKVWIRSIEFRFMAIVAYLQLNIRICFVVWFRVLRSWAQMCLKKSFLLKITYKHRYLQ